MSWVEMLQLHGLDGYGGNKREIDIFMMQFFGNTKSLSYTVS